jgi:chromosome segregation ATPase
MVQQTPVAPEKTAADVDREIQNVKAQVEGFKRDQQNLESSIAAAWGTDTSLLEQQYGQLTVRIIAAGKVIEKLLQERKLAEQRETVAEYLGHFFTWQDFRAKKEPLEKKIQEVQGTLKALEAQLAGVNRQGNLARGLADHVRNRLTELGVSPAVIKAAEKSLGDPEAA